MKNKHIKYKTSKLIEYIEEIKYRLIELEEMKKFTKTVYFKLPNYYNEYEKIINHDNIHELNDLIYKYLSLGKEKELIDFLIKGVGDFTVPNERIKHTGIKCPKCGKEMIYGDDNIILTTNPPQRYIYCLPCDYSTTIYC